MSEEIKEKLPQNIQHLLMEIGEKMVLFRLFLLVKNTDWNVFYNLGEVGCDLILLNSIDNRKLKIEVKTRQRLYSVSEKKKLNTVHYTVTENEYMSCDFVICYWVEENVFFIVPKVELKKTSSNDKSIYKFIVRKLVDGNFDENSSRFLEKWENII
jgi:hypothetical protein